jgi:hypothetical protein
MRRSGFISVIVLAAAGACGGGGGISLVDAGGRGGGGAGGGGVGDGGIGDGGPAQPRLIPGGGIGDGKIAGYLNVFVIDDETDAVVSSAAVRVGASATTTPCQALTDSTGFVAFDPQSCPSLVGPVDVTVSGTGYAPSTWIGVNGRNLTVGVRAISAPAVGRATVSGTFAGWDALPAPAANHTLLGFVGASQLPDLGDRANDMAQGTRSVDVDIGGTPYPFDIEANLCVRNALVNDCNWRLTTRTGAQAHYGVVLDLDDRGTPDDDTDDTLTVVGWWIKRNLSFGNGASASGETLERIPDADMQSLSVSFAAAPSGLDYVTGLPLLELGAEGRIAISLPALNGTTRMTRIPKPTGVLAGARYGLIASAVDAADKPQPATLTWLRNIDIATTVSVSGWLAPPAALTMSAGRFSFSPVAGATLHSAELQTLDGQRRWSITIFDGSTSFTLPGLSPDPLPLGSLRFAVSALRIPGVDFADIAFDDLGDKLTDIATDTITYAR